MQISIAKDVSAISEGLAGNAYRGGNVDRQWLLADNAPDGLTFRVFLSKYKPGASAFQSPRHHHGFQQIRWTESGSINYGPGQDIPEGDLAYFPRGTYYGPQTKDSGVSLLLQFGFGSDLPVKSIEMYREGAVIKELNASIVQLQKQGTIKDGVFIDIDPTTGAERRQDAGEAVAKAAGRSLNIPPERYASPILMHPRAYAAYEASPGVEIKRLGQFYDQAGPRGDVRLSQLRLCDGGEYRLGADRAQLAWSASAGLQLEGQLCPRLTFLYNPRNEEAAITGTDGVEVFLVEFPRLD